jgi:hypothetical protein
MSERWPGGLIKQTAPVPSGTYATSTASGVWTLDQQAYWKQQGNWPIPGNFINYIEDVFSTYLYTGNGTSQTINNGLDLNGKGGLTWIKARTAATYPDHWLWDTARQSGGYQYALNSNTTDAQQIGYTNNIAWTSTGFDYSTSPAGNQSGQNYCSWSFREQPKFFDIVTYTGNGSNTTISHNLGSVPGMIIVKRTDTTGAWQVYHRSLANTEYLVLNTTAAKATGATRWNSTTATSSVFSLGTDATVNASSGTYVAYLFAHDAGGFGTTGTDNVISCGSFTADGSGNATINLGYEPQWVIVKCSSNGSTQWLMLDTMRGWPTDGNVQELDANLSSAESYTSGIYPRATGFITSGGNFTNKTFIYMAIRRPMKVPTLGTSVYQANLYTGNGTANTTVAGNFGFPVDLMFLSSRTANATGWSTYGQIMFDRLRGQDVSLGTATTAADQAGWNTYHAFDLPNNTGWGLYGTNSGTGYLNNTGGLWVARGLRRASGFFDVVCYTGNGADTNLNHNLTVTPELIIVKDRTSNTPNWCVYYNGGSFNTIHLNLNGAAYSSGLWYGTPTSTTFGVSSNANVNASGETYVAYLFATCAGVSKVGSYTGNGSTQAIACGFTGGARFVLIKRTDSTGNWYVYDTVRGMTTLTDPYLLTNSTAAETATLGSVTTTTGGFTVDASILAAINTNAASYIFLAIS